MVPPFLKRNSGKLYFLLWSLGSLFSLLSKGLPSGHYDIFSAAPRMLWAGENPYGVIYQYGAFVYSPLAAVFYAPFAALPYAWGLALLSVFSWLVFVGGLRALMRHAQLGISWGEIFLFILSSEIIGAILNVRLEILMTGVLMWSGALLLEEKRAWLPWAMLALITNFKFQALAPTGLLLAYFVVSRRSLREVFYFGAFSLLYLLVPAVFWGWELNWLAHRTWLEYLGSALDIAFYTFQHAYAFVNNAFGVMIPYRFTQVISMLVGLAMIGWTLRKARKTVGFEEVMRPLALGSAFVCAFSPASQSAAYIFYAPLLLWHFCWGEKLWSLRGMARWIWLGSLVLGWFFVSLAYADVVGQAGRDYFFRMAIKPLGILILTASLYYFEFFGNQSLATGEPPTGSPLRAKR